VRDVLAPLAGRRVLLLSPHADDIAYSVCGLVARLAGRAELSLLTVFGRSSWALPATLRRAGPDAVSATRRREDEAYCARHGIAFSQLPVPDSALSGYDEAGELAGRPEDDPRTPDVTALIGDAIARAAPEVVLAPCAIGGHVDHRIVHAAARERADRDRHRDRDRAEGSDVTWLFYEDLPYAATLDLATLERALSAGGLVPAMTVDISEVLDDKEAGLWDYRSQTSAPTLVGTRLHAARLAGESGRQGERLWRPGPT
jgi:LmbE family N-acetylglucosaminyl deacetylase